MIKIKLGAIVFIFGLVGIILNSSHRFSSHAESDAADEIANYKSWSRITKEPIPVKFTIDSSGGG